MSLTILSLTLSPTLSFALLSFLPSFIAIFLLWFLPSFPPSFPPPLLPSDYKSFTRYLLEKVEHLLLPGRYQVTIMLSDLRLVCRSILGNNCPFNLYSFLRSFIFLFINTTLDLLAIHYPLDNQLHASIAIPCSSCINQLMVRIQKRIFNWTTVNRINLGATVCNHIRSHVKGVYYLSDCLFVYLSICLSVCHCLSICLSIGLSVCLSVCRFVCLSVWLSLFILSFFSVVLYVFSLAPHWTVFMSPFFFSNLINSTFIKTLAAAVYGESKNRKKAWEDVPATAVWHARRFGSSDFQFQ